MTTHANALVSLCAAIAAAIGIAACQPTGPRSEAPVAGAPASGSPELPAEAPRRADTPSDSSGKPLPPIDFDYALLGEPTIGQPLDIRVTSRVQVDLDALNVALSGDERMHVPAEMARFRMTRAAGAGPMSRTIRVTPLVEGTLYLDVLLEAEIDGRRQSRSVTIPIRVGTVAPAPPAPQGTVSTDADGQRIISLPGTQN